MSTNKGCHTSSGGAIWILGWMFTLGFLKLVWWKALLGLVLWPWYLGNALAAKFPKSVQSGDYVCIRSF
ncbi:hypothetical protein KKA00_10310 [bacterium]|nr:hypothetical protein [bacterium]MBU1652603.1 hypothetical protein [bacterium]